jgi:pilus assembly protein Flp/PilA
MNLEIIRAARVGASLMSASVAAGWLALGSLSAAMTMAALAAACHAPHLWARSRAFVRSERGASAAEYGLILALISAAIIAALSGLGGSVRHALNVVSSNIASAS